MRSINLSFPSKGMRERTRRQAEGKEPPSLGSGGPSLTAVGLRPEANTLVPDERARLVTKQEGRE